MMSSEIIPLTYAMYHGRLIRMPCTMEGGVRSCQTASFLDLDMALWAEAHQTNTQQSEAASDTECSCCRRHCYRAVGH